MADGKSRSQQEAAVAAEIAKALIASGGAQSGDAKKNPPVYLGMKTGTRVEGIGYIGEDPDVKNYQDVAGMWYEWDERERAKFRSALALTGADTSKMRDTQFAQAWADYVMQAAAYWNGGKGKRITPWDVLASDRSLREDQVRKPTTTTSTSTSMNLSTREDAMGIASAVSQQLLGRDMTPAEVDDLLKKLNAGERANPSITKATSTTNPDGTVTNQSSTTTGGFSDTARRAIAEEEAKGSEGYAEYQASTTFYDALMEMM